MTTTWTAISAEEALHHPLYGTGGWLWLFMASLLFGIASSWLTTAAVLNGYGVSLGDVIGGSGEAATYLQISLFGWTTIALTILGLLLLASPLFPTFAITVIALSWPMGAALRFGAGLSNSQEEIAAFAGWLVAICIWIPYLARSTRVNVTYKHRVKVPEPASAAMPVQSGAARSTVNAYRTQAAGAPHAERPSYSTMDATDGCETCWASAYAELKSTDRRAGVWAKSFVNANGDSTLAEVLYLKERVGALHIEHSAPRA